MNLELSLHNLAVWIAQVFLISMMGALLPFFFRIRHSRSNLAYCQLLLVAALLLPLIQPAHREVIVRDTEQTAVFSAAALGETRPAQDSVPWSVRDMVLGFLVAGFIVRLGWLVGGLWQIRRLRISSAVLDPLPQSVQRAREITGADALFCVSETVKGPVTFGFRRPVVLVPASFLKMLEAAQLSIACHELVHIRRNDWVLTLAEELIASLLWFQPAVWWLVGQCRLAREQLVDKSVVSLTAAPESYISTLFSLATGKWEADVGVAALFLRRRHLTHRVHSLLMEVSMSRMRLVCSYCSMAAILAVAGGLMFVLLPLTGQAETAQGPSRVAQNTLGFVVNRSPIFYPVAAQQKRVEGTVVVELTFNVRGEIVDSRVLSGPEELRQAGLQTALQGSYPIDTARTLQVVVDFKLPAAVPGAARGVRGAAGQPGPGQRGVSNIFPQAGTPPPLQPGNTAPVAARLRVGDRVAALNLSQEVKPEYPAAAKVNRIEGLVVIEADISRDGRVERADVISGDPVLAQAAQDAVRQWVYKPILLNGKPTDVVTRISVSFQNQD